MAGEFEARLQQSLADMQSSESDSENDDDNRSQYPGKFEESRKVRAKGFRERNWTNEETEELLEVYQSQEISQKLETTSNVHKASVFQAIARELRSRLGSDFIWSGPCCKVRLKNLLQKYRRAKRQRMLHGLKVNKSPYFDEMERIFEGSYGRPYRLASMNDASGPSTYCNDDQRGFCLASLGAASELSGAGGVSGGGSLLLGSQRYTLNGLRETAQIHSMSAVLLGTLALFVALASVFGRWVKRLLSFSSKTLSSPKLYHRDTPLSRFLREHCASLSKPFRPTFWAINAHAQTLLAVLLPQKWVRFTREYLQMDDRGVVALDIAKPAGWTLYKESPIMIIVPDLNTDCRSTSDLAWLALQRGYRVMVFNRRGHGGISLTTSKLQSYGDASDLREAVSYIHQCYHDAKLSCIGLGAGGGLLIAFLGEYGSSADLAAAVCISPSYDCQELYGSHRMPQPYHWLALQRSKLSLRRHVGNLSDVIDPIAAFGASSLSALEEAVFAKIHKQPNMDAYWEANNPLRDVDEISSPLLCLSSLDDPVHPSDLVPFDLFTTLPDVMLATTARGGYCGFYEGFQPQSWAHRVAVDYIESVFQYTMSLRTRSTSNQNCLV